MFDAIAVSLKSPLRWLTGALAATSCVAALAGGPAADEAHDYRKTFVSGGSFAEVRDNLELAITGRGIVINNVSHIGNMLERTGKDVGSSVQVFEHAEALEFCSAVLSRKMMEADPHNIVFCPYIVSVYTLPGEKDKVYLSYRRPQMVGSEASRESLTEVEQLLDDIIDESIVR